MPFYAREMPTPRAEAEDAEHGAYDFQPNTTERVLSEYHDIPARVLLSMMLNLHCTGRIYNDLGCQHSTSVPVNQLMTSFTSTVMDLEKL